MSRFIEQAIQADVLYFGTGSLDDSRVEGRVTVFQDGSGGKYSDD